MHSDIKRIIKKRVFQQPVSGASSHASASEVGGDIPPLL
jgi:hypothetical protein